MIEKISNIYVNFFFLLLPFFPPISLLMQQNYFFFVFLPDTLQGRLNLKALLFLLLFGLFVVFLSLFFSEKMRIALLLYFFFTSNKLYTYLHCK
jgi:hypothetical protein